MKTVNLLLSLIFWVSSLLGQDFAYNDEKQTYPLSGEVNGKNIKKDYKPTLDRLKKAPLPGGKEAESRLQQVKANIGPKTKPRQKSRIQKDSIPNPVIKGFEGNPPNGIPNDNHLAISNGGTIVSVTNSLISIYDTTGQKEDEYSLEAFAEDLNISGSKYDPRVLYDPKEDRFVIGFLNGKIDTTSSIIVAFSESNDPTGNWNLYSLPGDPLNDTSWSDFPMMAMTEGELFISVNLLYNDSSWQEGFKQSIVWQIDKASGYGGDSLKTKLYKDIEYKQKRIRNLTLIQGGMGLKGPNIYMLSNQNFAKESDTFYLLEITGRRDQPSTELTLEMVRSNEPYGAPPAAAQPKNDALATNDARILSGFIQNGEIHLVGNTINPYNYASIYHGIIKDLNNPKINLKIFRHWEIEYGYPSVAFIGENPKDDHALITANHTGDTINPGLSAVYYKEGEYSGFEMLKKGETYINAYRLDTERWGDYSGLQRKYNENGEIWASGYFGKKGSGLGRQNLNGTWISQLQPSWPEPTTVENKVSSRPEVKTYPNPTENFLRVKFDIEKARQLNFALYDQRGHHLTTLMESWVKPGTARLSFSMAPLESGIYILRITDQKGELVASKKLVKN